MGINALFHLLRDKKIADNSREEALWKEVVLRNEVQEMIKSDGWKAYMEEIEVLSGHLTLDNVGDKDIFTLDKDKFLVAELIKREQSRWFNAVDNIIKRGDEAETELKYIESQKGGNR